MKKAKQNCVSGLTSHRWRHSETPKRYRNCHQKVQKMISYDMQNFNIQLFLKLNQFSTMQFYLKSTFWRHRSPWQMTPNLSLGFSKSVWITCMLSIAYEKWHQWFIKTRKDKIQRLCGTQIVYLDENLCIVLANVCCHVWWLLGKHFAQPGRDFSLHLTEQCSGGRTKHRVLFQERVPWKKMKGPF